MTIEDIIRAIVREELEAILVPYLADNSKVPPAIIEKPTPVVEAEPVEMVEEIPVTNTADLMAKLKEMASRGKGIGARCKKILIENFEYEKYSEVPDDEAQTVYNKVMELL